MSSDQRSWRILLPTAFILLAAAGAALAQSVSSGTIHAAADFSSGPTFGYAEGVTPPLISRIGARFTF